jgi:hypothetical protein
MACHRIGTTNFGPRHCGRSEWSPNAGGAKISAALGVEQRVEWRKSGLPNLPLGDREADVTYCVEVVEHAGTDASVVAELGRITRDMLVISAPNRLFPCIQHDTGLPFCHWLPLRARDVYAGLVGRRHLQDSNLFWSPNMLLAALPEFERVSSLLQFKDVSHFMMVERMLAQAFGVSGIFRRTVFSAASLLGPFALYVLPNLASTFRRRVGSAPP